MILVGHRRWLGAAAAAILTLVTVACSDEPSPLELADITTPQTLPAATDDDPTTTAIEESPAPTGSVDPTAGADERNAPNSDPPNSDPPNSDPPNSDPPNSDPPNSDPPLPEPDWGDVVHGLQLINHALQATPESADISVYCADPSPCLETSDVVNMAERGERLVNAPPPPPPLDATLIDTSLDEPWHLADLVVVRVTDEVPPWPDDVAIVDSNGAVVVSVGRAPDAPAVGQPVVSAWTLTMVGSEWRVHSVVALDR